MSGHTGLALFAFVLSLVALVLSLYAAIPAQRLYNRLRRERLQREAKLRLQDIERVYGATWDWREHARCTVDTCPDLKRRIARDKAR